MEVGVTQALMIALISGVGILDGRIMGMTMIDRPLVTGAFVGLVLGDLKTGVIIGAQLELIWMGLTGIGASTPPDVVTGGVLGTAFAMISGQGVEIALALAVPIAILAQSLGITARIINAFFGKKADAYAKEANFRGIAMMLWIPVCIFFLSTFVPTFLAIILGADKVTAFIESVPPIALSGLRAAGKLLPAIGFALLMDMLLSKKMAVFFFLGFLGSVYIGLDVTAIALFAVCIGIILNLYITSTGASNKGSTETKFSNNLLEGEIDFE